MQTININSFPCLSEPKRIERLNHLTAIHDNLMPHEVAIATGCSLDEAMLVLLLLFRRSAADAFLLVYHKKHIDDGPIMSRKIMGGFPQVPFTCDTCEEEIESLNDLSFGFIFKMIDKVLFQSEKL